ncbi:hypothetical protein PMAC_002640 [Pneumocystis sp. 'macacae']|nr:hypothetical protein PMAC_002640 [Pneumocystis sp. 'macacae']
MTLTAAQQECAAAKVLRRAEISRITRLLKSRLTLASYKTSRGWQNLALDSIAPRVADQRFAAPHPHHKRPRTASVGPPHSRSAPTHRLHQSSPVLRPDSRSSPPHTPPRGRPPQTGEEGVDLLIYLATSPSPHTVGARFRMYASVCPADQQPHTHHRASTSPTLSTSRRRLRLHGHRHRLRASGSHSTRRLQRLRLRRHAQSSSAASCAYHSVDTHSRPRRETGTEDRQCALLRAAAWRQRAGAPKQCSAGSGYWGLRCITRSAAQRVWPRLRCVHSIHSICTVYAHCMRSMHIYVVYARCMHTVCVYMRVYAGAACVGTYGCMRMHAGCMQCMHSALHVLYGVYALDAWAVGVGAVCPVGAWDTRVFRGISAAQWSGVAVCLMASIKCIFCKIVAGEMAALKLYETERSLAFLDIRPLSRGHALVVPKEHAEKMHQLSDASLGDLLPLAKRLVNAMGLEDYNILQNNGRLAHQVVDHVHFHLIPKPTAAEGLRLGFDAAKAVEEDVLRSVAEEIRKQLGQC